MSTLILYGLAAGFFSLIGGFILIWKSDIALKIMTSLLSFAAGAFMAVSFIDILPEAIEAVEEPRYVFYAALAGFISFFTLERFLMRYLRRHDEADTGKYHSDHTESLPILVVLGDSLHNLLDGVIIALTFLADPSLGLITTLAIAAHEIPQEIGDFTILLNQGWSKSRIVVVNIFSSLMSVAGVVIGYYAGLSFEEFLPYLLAGVAGVFIYIAASDLVPEVHHRAGHSHVYRILLPFLLSVVIIGYLISITHA